MKGTLYLIPAYLAPESSLDLSIPNYNLEVVSKLKHFIVENEKSARAFLKASGVLAPYNQKFYLLDKRTKKEEYEDFLVQIGDNDFGIMSEAGCPGIADPGGPLIRLCHFKGINVVPLVGPSSIVMALMSSGFNGQVFSFSGYLPVAVPDRIRKIKELENVSFKFGNSQIFMETPFRTEIMLRELCKYLQSTTWLHVSAGIHTDRQLIKSARVGVWKQFDVNLVKGLPAVFIIYAGKK